MDIEPGRRRRGVRRISGRRPHRRRERWEQSAALIQRRSNGIGFTGRLQALEAGLCCLLMALSVPKRQAIDTWGDRWDVYEERPTDFNFLLLLGRPEGTNRGGSLTLIVTDELSNHLRALAELRKMHSLPIGNTTIKKARRLLGIDWRAERAGWWDERFDDLAELSVEEFAATHSVSVGAVINARHAIFGSKLRPYYWWREPSIAAMLLADMPSAEIAANLGIAATSVRRLRSKLRKENEAGR